MEDILTQVARLTRPQLLVQTARHGMPDYRRTLHLRRILRTDTLPRPAEALVRLLEVERMIDDQRQQERASYSIARHIEVLIALMNESRTLAAMRRSRDRTRDRAADAPAVMPRAGARDHA